MREILFRGKSANNGEWVYGDLVQLHDGRRYIINNRHGACIDDKGNFLNTEAPFVCEVDPETVGQFTVLIDKNGKKIFEGDILKFQINIHTFILGKITFLCGAFVFESTELDRECDLAFVTFADDEIALPKDCIEVIGNIHDNPELMEGA